MCKEQEEKKKLSLEQFNRLQRKWCGLEYDARYASETALKSQTARFSADILVIEQSRHCRKTKYSLKISEIPPTFYVSYVYKRLDDASCLHRNQEIAIFLFINLPFPELPNFSSNFNPKVRGTVNTSGIIQRDGEAKLRQSTSAG